MYEEYLTNSLPVHLVWSGTAGTSTLTIKKSHGGATVLVTNNLAGTSFNFQNAEVGRNYTWAVENGASAATGHFFTERVAPRILHYVHNGMVDNARDFGGWTTADGKVVKQGLFYRCRQMDWFTETGLPYWRDVLGIKLDIDLRTQEQIQANVDEYGGTLRTSPIDQSIPRFTSEFACAYPFGSYAEIVTQAGYRTAFHRVFTNMLGSASIPAVVHCAHGKDRTGALAYILNGLLGVPLQDLRLDWVYSWAAKDTWTLSSFTIDQLTTALNNRYPTAQGYTTLQSRCEAYVKECGATDAQIATFKTMMLEDPETPAADPTEAVPIAKPTVSPASGTSFTPNGAVQKPAVEPATAEGYTVSWGSTDWTTAGTHTLTITLNFENTTVTPIPIWINEAGSSLFDGQGLVLTGVGTGYIEGRANTTNIFAVVTATDNIALRFNPTSCDGAVARFENEGGIGTTTLGWFEGGAEGTTQTLLVNNACVNFIKADAVNSVAGALAVEVFLGGANTNTAPVSVAGTLNINAGSTLTIHAGGMPPGTYAILSAGALNADASVVESGITVTGLAANTEGEVVQSGSTMNLVITVGEFGGDPVIAWNGEPTAHADRSVTIPYDVLCAGGGADYASVRVAYAM